MESPRLWPGEVALTTVAKIWVNRLLQGANLRLDTLTIERAEKVRLERVNCYGQFSQPPFEVPHAFQQMDAAELFQEVERHTCRFEDFRSPERNTTGYSFDNPYFSSPDAEVLYAVVRRFQPSTVVEIGCGHTTRLLRQAALDGGLATRLVAIDPSPRRQVRELVDEFHECPVEHLPISTIPQALGENDILFIDSSHVLRTGGDVAYLYLQVLPKLRPGVLIHVHDIFLPYDYPRRWVIEERWGFNEQYLVEAILLFSNAFQILWAGYYLQKMRQDFSRFFPNQKDRTAQSLWMRKI